MTILATVALLLAQAAAATEVRTVTITAADGKGVPIEGLVPEEVAVLENGTPRPLKDLVRDQRPLTLLFLLDTSQVMGSDFRLNVRDAVMSFLRNLPEGSVYSLWTTGDRPTKAVDFTADPDEAVKALNRVFPQGGNTMLDAIVEASSELKKKEGERSVVVIVTAMGPEFSTRIRQQVVEQARDNADVFLVIQIEEGTTDFEMRTAYDYVLAGLPDATGGLNERILSFLALRGALQRVTAELRAQYRLSYETPSDLKTRKIEVKVARPDVRIRVSPPRRTRSS
jgi:VWFA-related protein